MKNNEIDIINRLIDKAVVGVDNYNHNGSRWLIFTNSKKWVIELTKKGTLWYNYYFFQNIFKLLSLDLVDNQHYITKWVEDNIISKVNHTKGEYYKEIQKVEYTIQNGVKDIKMGSYLWGRTVEDTIQNGVKDTRLQYHLLGNQVEDTIQNGVKETHSGCDLLINDKVEDTIENGVKHISNRRLVVSKDIEDTVQNGVKETNMEEHHRLREVIQTVKNGIKETKTPSDGDIRSTMEWMKEKETNSVPKMIDDIIENGVKEIHVDVIPHTGIVESVIKNGIKKTEGAMLFDESKLDDIVKPENKIN